MSTPKQGGKLTIPQYRHKKMDQQSADKTWQSLENAIYEIQNKNASQLSFEELYRNSYNLCLNRYGEMLYKGVIKVLTNSLVETSAKIAPLEGQLFLKTLQDKWGDHYKSTSMIKDILMYMDRTYVTQAQEQPVLSMGIDLWRELVIKHQKISVQLQQLMLEQVAKERQGEVIDRPLMKQIASMLMDLGKDVYIQLFEDKYLQGAQEFYQREAQEYFQHFDCPTYLQKAEERLSEESERVKSYLDSTTEPKIIKVVENELIAKQKQALIDKENSGFIEMLKDQNVESRANDLRRMYLLFKPVSGGSEMIKTYLYDYIKNEGTQLIRDPGKSKSPNEFIQKLLEMKSKYDTVVKFSLCDVRVFVQAVNRAFEDFINQNPRSPELISLYMDERLRKGTKANTEDDIEKTMDQVMVIFRYITEKDLFEKYYKQHLAKRLLSGRSISDDQERSLLVKLKQECGYQFTSKLESMFMDIKTSQDLSRDFRNDCEAKKVPLQADLQVNILTTGSWPSQSSGECILPPQLQSCCEVFQEYYTRRHSGRKLIWYYQMGSGDLRVEARSRHELTVSTYQICVLILFNKNDKLSYQEIQQQTNIPELELKRALQSLACVKGRQILKKVVPGKDVQDDDEFVFNEGFTYKLYKIKVNTVSASKESEPSLLATRQRVEEDRNPLIEAAIVRLMKSRKILDHNSVITEVSKQLENRFKPDPQVIKKRIESLIERDFLERDPDDRRKYRYLA